jgi:TonB-linked SusC/RagA family outer membrane protein
MRRFLQLFSLLLFTHLTIAGFAQQPISGRVAAGDTALVGVTVQVKGTTTSTQTDANGQFTINASPNSTLVFSSVGYESEEVKVGNRSTFDVRLQSSSHQLEQVVVVGYGTQRKATATGAVSAIKGSEVLQSPAINVSNNLVGRLPGLVAVQGSGEPGYDRSNLRIRGANTLNNNDVLVVVDGVPGRSLERIDPNSIENITILKDASAAIYGAQAANGVILVTTKRGRLGKPTITLNMNKGYNQPTRIPKMADAATYATMLNEIAMYNGSPAVFSPEDIQKYSDGSSPWTHPNTDWFKETLKPRSAQDAYNLTISGGTEALRYFVSAGTRSQEGNYYHSATRFKQHDFRSNLDGKITKDISISFDIAGRMEDRKFPTRSAGDIFWMVMRGKPTLPAYWPDGTPGPDIEYGNNPVVISTDATGYDRDKFYALNSNAKVNINIPWVKGLSVTGNAAIDKGFGFRKQWYTPWYLYTWDYQTYDENNNPVLIKGKRGFEDPRLNQSMRDETRVLLNALLNYDRKFGADHTFKFLVGTESNKGRGDYFSAFRRFFASTEVDQLNVGGAAEMNNGGSGYINERLNYFGRVNYGFRDKYLAEFVWRYDGSYIFPEDRRYGFFPGISAGWRISEEDFWKNSLSFINNFKLRASWGQTGNDRIPEWQYLATYQLGNFFGFGNFPFVTGNGAENPTLFERGVANPEITWEIANQGDIGFDASLFQNKLTIEADYFNYKRSQILIPPSASVPTTAGFTPPFSNIGRVSNKGYDFNVSYRDRVGKFNYQVSVNGGYAKNRITFWDETPGAPEYQRSTGRPMNTGLYYIAEGVFVDSAAVNKVPHWSNARPGDVIFKDVNNDGKIDADDRVRVEKSGLPTFTGGMGINLQYGGFDLSALFQGATGAVNYVSTESGEIGNFLESFAKNRWTPENPSSTTPRTFNRGNEYWRGQASTMFLHKTDYIRLKSLQFGYSLPSTLSGRLGFQTARIFVSGFNLFTYSPDYRDFDPEGASGNGTNYPLQRVVNGGISVTF